MLLRLLDRLHSTPKHGNWFTNSTHIILLPRTRRKRPSDSFIMLALWMAVTVFRWFSSAYSNAYCAMRRDFSAVMTCRVSCF